MLIVVSVRLHDWTGRSGLYLFAASTPIEVIKQTYAKERSIPEELVTLRVFNSKERTIHTTMLNEIIREVNVVEKEEDENQVCQIFAFIDFVTGTLKKTENSLRYMTDSDKLVCSVVCEQ